MTDLNIMGLDHKFGTRGVDNVDVIVVDCSNCEKQCGFTGLYLKDVVIRDGKNIVEGEASTTVYETDSLESFKTTELDDMKQHTLKLGSIQGDVPLEGLNEYTVNAVSDCLKAGQCLVNLAQKQAETAVL